MTTTGQAASELVSYADRFRRRRRVPAVGVAVLRPDAQPQVAVAGVRVRGRAQRVSPVDRWHIGSCAKAMTAALYARMVGAGQADWVATVPALFGDLAEGIHPGWRDVTIDQLLTHRAGLPANLAPEALDAAFVDRRSLRDQRTAAARAAFAVPPGAVGNFLYSNLGYVLAGAAIERIGGRSWEECVAADLLHPLGITSAGFGAPVGDQPWGHGARWRHRRRGQPVDPGEASNPAQRADNPPIMGPAGRIHLSLPDWARFVDVFLAGGGSLLRPESIERLTTQPDGPGPSQAMGWAVPVGRALRRRCALGQQGCNTLWVATALIGVDRDRAVLVVVNDGRLHLLRDTAGLAVSLLG